MGILERKEREKEQRLSAIIDAAEKLFFKKGIHQTTMEDIAKEAELSKGTLYLYFKNKEDLHYSSILRGMNIMTKLFQKYVSDELSGLENIMKIGRAYVEFFEKHNKRFKLMMEFHASKFEKVAENKKGRILDDDSPLVLVSNIIQQGQKDGSIRNDMNSNELAIILWSQLNGFLEFVTLRKSLLDVFNLTESSIIQNQFNVLLNGIIKKEK